MRKKKNNKNEISDYEIDQIEHESDFWDYYELDYGKCPECNRFLDECQCDLF